MSSGSLEKLRLLHEFHFIGKIPAPSRVLVHWKNYSSFMSSGSLEEFQFLHEFWFIGKFRLLHQFRFITWYLLHKNSSRTHNLIFFVLLQKLASSYATLAYDIRLYA